MNRNLVIFSLLVILAGLFSGFYLISFIGLLLLIPALLSPTRVPTRPAPAPEPSRPPPRRITPPPVKHPENPMQAQPGMQTPPPDAMVASTPAYMVSSVSQSTSIAYTPPLFPTSLFPSLSGMTGPFPPPPKEAEHPRPRGEDELLDVAALLVLLRLFSG